MGNGSGLAHLTKKYIKFLKTGKKISKKILYFLPWNRNYLNFFKYSVKTEILSYFIKNLKVAS